MDEGYDEWTDGRKDGHGVLKKGEGIAGRKEGEMQECKCGNGEGDSIKEQRVDGCSKPPGAGAY